MTRGADRGLGIPTAFIVVAVGLLACSTSTTTVTQATSVTPHTSPSPPPSSPLSTVCFDRAKIIQLSHQWQKSQNLWQLHTIDHEIALNLALATAADPALSGRFQHAADIYATAPVSPKNAPIGSITQAELSKLFKVLAAGATAMRAAVDALGNSSVPFC
jgi:hypothetical protein